ncbi:NfeD family protein [Phaeocystidibacter luteus]|uniref:Uncharacterized protein n=1 Tax=Phaeocystidibacter luteus TaxID=911197 RepID=A0A6N6RHV1_9FLAO|nr:NfeD family protein [Phaeocystidibacter luteus]KAB2813854.1 hypothetical protein F8C67_03995 [Phaeocystidibacter luteus]
MDFSEWWASYDSFAQVLWVLALISSLLFVLQMASALLMGDTESAFGDSDEFVDTDTGVGYQFFTFRNAVTFFMMFGWVGLGVYTEGNSEWVTILWATLAGALMVFIMAWLMKKIGSLKQDGSMKISNAIGKVGTVYLPIKANGAGTGKVQIPIQGSTHELSAVTTQSEDLPTGATVEVTDVKPGNILVVQKLN